MSINFLYIAYLITIHTVQECQNDQHYYHHALYYSAAGSIVLHALFNAIGFASFAII